MFVFFLAWSNHAFGGSLYICVNGNILSGAFSNLGIVEGIISADGRSVNGNLGLHGLC
jgi:hypothetical protein